MPSFAETLAAQRAENAAQVAALDAAEAERSENADAWRSEVGTAADAVAGARSRYERVKADSAATIARARAEEAAARQARIDATAVRDRLLREAYATGATARSLAEVAGISVPRVNQIVAGAR